MEKDIFFIMKWIDFFIVLFTLFANSRLNLSDKITSVILLIALMFIILISIIEKIMIQGTKD